MTTTDSQATTPSPTNAPTNLEHTTKPEPSEPVVSTDVPSPSTANAPSNDHAADSTVLSQTSEAEQPIHVAEEQPTPDLPTRPQADVEPAERIPPEVESLKAMFPDFDVPILQSVFESVNGDQERAADVLLGMSDPNYVSQDHHAPSQSDLDEQLARRLVLEEQQQAASWHPDQHYPLTHDLSGRVPYQPRIQQGQQHGDQPQWESPSAAGGGGKDTMTEVQEQFSKFAETGKKTFSSLFTKVKAKMQEFDQSRNQSGSAPQSSWGSGTPSGAPPGPSGDVPPNQYQYNQYSSPPSQPQPQGQRSPPPGAVQGYDAQPPSAAGTGLGSSYSTASSAAPSGSPPSTERIPPRPSSAGPPPAGNVDPTKIGMLPKRPVSLLGSTPAQSQPNTIVRRDTEDDELDYVENPFEEGKK